MFFVRVPQKSVFCKHFRDKLCVESKGEPLKSMFIEELGAGMTQWCEHSPPTNVAGIRFLVLVSYVGWVSCWFLSLLLGFFSGYSGFPASLKTNIPKFDLETVD